LAYWPKNYEGAKTTLQSRNALIGSYTEKWVTDLFSEIAKSIGGYSVQCVICEEIGLPNQSPADVAICKTKDVIQQPQNVLMIIEVKMSVVWNWELMPENSDTMLKAIGKSINIRVASFSASKIPIIVIGNTPITKSYYDKVDHLKRNGIIQGFWSINPNPLDDNGENIKSTPYKGFYLYDDYKELKQNALNLLKEEREFFCSMQTRRRLGEFVETANRETTYEAKAVKFLELLHQSEK